MRMKFGAVALCALSTAILYAAVHGNLDRVAALAKRETATVLRTMGVRNTFTAAVASDQPVESLAGELPAHDPTVGRLAGSAGTSGGAATYSIPIALPPGRRGMQPSLALEYSSRSGNGIAGMGWSLSGLSALHRCPNTIEQDGMVAAVAMTNADKLCLDGQRLVPTSGTYGQANTAYDTELDSFVRVTQLGGDLQSASTYFKVETKSGEILWYGNNAASANSARVIPGGATAPLSWMLMRKEDRVGNFVRYAYTDFGNGEVLVSDVVYTGFGSTDGDRHVTFAYQARPSGASDNDQSSSWLAGTVTRQTQRLATISTWAGTTGNANNEVREYRLSYQPTTSQSTHRSLLASVTECGMVQGQATCRRPTTFAWQQGATQTAFHKGNLQLVDGTLLSIMGTLPDYTGDGLHKVEAQTDAGDMYIVSLNADHTMRGALDVSGFLDPGFGLNPFGVHDTYPDFDGDGKADVMDHDANGNVVVHFWDGPANATTFAEAFTRHWTTSIPYIGTPVTADYINTGILYTGDMNGDGRPDLVRYQEYPNNPDSCRATLQVYLNVPNAADPSQPGTFQLMANPPCIVANRQPYGVNGVPYQFTYENPIKFADLNGDGLIDIVLSQPDQFDYGRNYPWRILYGTRSPTYGFTSAPYLALFQGNPVGADEVNPKSTILWPDINGDGLPDYAIARSTGWGIRMNTGKGLGPMINTGAHNGIGLCGAWGAAAQSQCGTDLYVPWYSQHIRISDIDADGRQELLIPAQIVSQICNYMIDHTNQLDPQIYYACPEDPVNGALSAPKITDEVRGTNITGDEFQDGSAYRMDALRFVETAPGVITVRQEATSRVHSLTSTVTDVYGTGLEGSLENFRCQFAGARQCQLGTEPGTLPDGSKATTPGTYVNENIGPGGKTNPDGLTPELPDLMSMVTDGMGGQTVWTYYPLSSNAGRAAGDTPLYTLPTDPAQRYVDARHTCFSSSMPVVSDMSTSDGVGGFHSLRYGYSQAMYNQQGRGFQGFRTIIEEDLTAGLRTTTTFNQKFPLASRVAEVVVNAIPSTGTTSPIRREVYTWRCNRADRSDATACTPPNGNATIKFPFLDEKDTYTYDGTTALAGGTPFQVGLVQDINADDPNCAGTIGTASGFDARGNLLKHTVLSSDSGTGTGGMRAFVTQRCVNTSAIYSTAANDLSAWWLDKLTSVTTTTKIAYDATNHPLPSGTSNPLQKVTTSYTWNADRTPAKQTVQAGIANQEKVTTYGYPSSNNYGLPNTVTVIASGDPNGARVSSIGYSADGYFAATTTNALGQSASVTTSPRDGEPTLTVDVNGLRTLLTYDAFGQLVKSQFHGTSDGVSRLPDAQVALTWCAGCGGVPNAVYQSTTVQDGAPTKIVTYDLYGRVLQAGEREQDGSLPLVQTVYDALGRVQQTSTPYTNVNSRYWTTFQYDALGRVTQKVVPKTANDGRGDLVTSYTYAGTQTAIHVCGTLDSDASKCLDMTRTTDSLGRYMETVDALSGVTQYWYDGAGSTLALKDAKNAVTKASYNAIGQRTSVNDPNQGLWSFTYDALGEVLTQTDARGIVTSTTYDPLGRPLTRSASIDVTGDGVIDNVVDSWTYDPLHGIGEAATSQRMVYASQGATGAIERSQVYTYDTLARPVQTDTHQQIAPGSYKDYSQNLAYDGYYGRPKSTGYPNGEAVATYYSKYGHAIRSFNPLDGSVFREVTAVDARGNPTVAQLGGGLITDTRTYRARTGELLSIGYTEGGASLRQLSYLTDVYGNLTRQNLNVGATIENYTYDNLQRMTKATRSGAVAASTSYTYDAAGNFTSKSDFSTTAANAYVYSGGTCGGGANAVKSVKIATGGTRTYCYDADGNLTSDSAGLAVQYDHDNLPVKTTRGTATINLAYGPDNQRTREWGSTDGAGTKVYLDGYEDWIGQGSTKIYVGTEAEITVNGGTRTVNYLLTDRLGSVDSIADATGNLIETRGSDAFGKPRSGTWADLSPAQLQSTAITAKGFTEHEHLNSVQLIHMNGRVYDYQIGRFLSVDPFIQFPLNSQSLNPYSYVLNNPLAGTDPTGYATECMTKHDCIQQEDQATASWQTSDFNEAGASGSGKSVSGGQAAQQENGALKQGSGRSTRGESDDLSDPPRNQGSDNTESTTFATNGADVEPDRAPPAAQGATTYPLGSGPVEPALQAGPLLELVISPVPGTDIPTRGHPANYADGSFSPDGSKRIENGHGRPHYGVDYINPLDTDVRAPFSGKIVKAESVSGFGKGVAIKSGNFYMFLGHMDKLTVKFGDYVAQNEKLGVVGFTRGTTMKRNAPHLHVEASTGGYLRDPHARRIDPTTVIGTYIEMNR